MRDSKHGWLAAWATLGGTVIAAATFYFQFVHPHQSVQSFSVPIETPNTAKADTMRSLFKRESVLDFQVKHCDVGAKVVWCALSVVSPRYDRRLQIFSYQTVLIDDDGDRFPMSPMLLNLSLDRDQTQTFKLQFPVNKDIARPATVQMIGSIDNQQFEKSFEIR